MVQRCGVHARIKSIVLVRKTNLLPIYHIGLFRYCRHRQDLQKVGNARRGALLPRAVALQIKERPAGCASGQSRVQSLALGTESRGTTRADAHRDPPRERTAGRHASCHSVIAPAQPPSIAGRLVALQNNNTAGSDRNCADQS
jgi:hypothetical protein